MHNFEDQVAEHCFGFVRPDVRQLTHIFWHYQRLRDGKEHDISKSISNPQDGSDPSHSQEVRPPSSSSPTCLSPPSPQSQTSEVDVEDQVRQQYRDTLENFKEDLKQRLKNSSGTLFDSSVNDCLTMLYPEGALPWAEYRGSTPEYLAMSAKEFQRTLTQNQTLPSRPLVVRNDVTDLSPALNEHFLSILESQHQGHEQGIQARDFSLGADEDEDEKNEEGENNYNHDGDDDESEDNKTDNEGDESSYEEGGEPERISYDDLCSRYRNSCDQPGFTDANLPINCLDFYDLGMPRSSLLSGYERYQGIKLASRKLHNLGTGKSSYLHSTILACTAFELFGLRGAYSGPHCDIYGGTYVTCLSGLKAWLVYTAPVPTHNRAPRWIGKFQRYGPSWSPPGRFKLILLRPGDTIVLPPGAMIVHAVLTIESSVMSGGMFLDNQQLDWHAKYVSYLVAHNRMTNEHISDDFPSVWQKLKSMYRERLDQDQKARFDREDERLRNCPSCTCLRKRKKTPRKCPSSCPCLKRNLKRGCSNWCHAATYKC